MSMTAAVFALGVTLSIALGWRRRIAPAAGAAAGILLLLAGGLLDVRDLGDAGRALWRPVVTIASIMLMTTCAHHLGLLERLAAVIEPTTRGPARRAFRAVFVLSALSAAALSNDGAILVLTPTVVALLRQVYPRRHVRFVVPFAFAVFCAAGVAPLVTSNPMNLMVADRAGIGFNAYALRMVPVALVGWLTTYLALCRVFRDVLSDEAPALGRGPGPPPPLRPAAWLVVAALAIVLIAYPLVSFASGPLWAVALCGAVACVVVTVGAGIPARAVALGPSWEIVPFLGGVVLLATGLERVGVVGTLADLFAAAPAPMAVVGAVSAAGAALIDNHAMGLLGWLALERTGGDPALVLAALVGGDLGPRLLPIGSLAGLLWLGSLRRLGVGIGIGRFIRVGALVTVPTLVTTLTTLWLVTRL